MFESVYVSVSVSVCVGWWGIGEGGGRECGRIVFSYLLVVVNGMECLVSVDFQGERESVLISIIKVHHALPATCPNGQSYHHYGVRFSEQGFEQVASAVCKIGD